jgi:hypothetical protein
VPICGVNRESDDREATSTGSKETIYMAHSVTFFFVMHSFLVPLHVLTPGTTPACLPVVYFTMGHLLGLLTNWKRFGSAHGVIEVLSWNLPEGAKESLG